MKIGDQRLAHFGTAAAAIVDQEKDGLAEAGQVGAIDDRAPFALRGHQPGLGQDAEIGRKRVRQHLEAAGQFAGRQPAAAGLDQRAEGGETPLMGEGGEACDGACILDFCRLV